MRKIHWRTLFRWRKHTDPIAEFLNNTMPAIEKLEKEGALLVSSSDEAPGIVLNHTMSQYMQSCYLIRMSYYTKAYGLETFLRARDFMHRFARKHNPDMELLNLCQNARMVINFRRAAKADGHGSNEKDISEYELKDDEPLFITYMNEDLTDATHIGYEKSGEIVLEEAKKLKKKEN